MGYSISAKLKRKEAEYGTVQLRTLYALVVLRRRVRSSTLSLHTARALVIQRLRVSI